MIYVAIAGWVLAALGWWGAWNVFQNLRIVIRTAVQREQQLLQERIQMIDGLRNAIRSAGIEYDMSRKSNAKGGGPTIN
jgi:hypothetical protein